jgi:hypothetical protein
MTHDPDRDLAQLFHAERVVDAPHAPTFPRVLAGPAHHRKRTVTWPVIATSAALVVVIALLRLTSEPEPPFTLRAGDLRVPTDYLLDLATYPRAGEIPPIGNVNWFPLNGTDASPGAEPRRQQ